MTQPLARIELRSEAYETVASETLNRLPFETGGILLGYREGADIVVTHALVVNAPRASTNQYVRDDVIANELLRDFLEQRARDDPTGYIGEWHSHPQPSGPSPTDIAAIQATATANDRLICLLVHAPSRPDPFVGLIARRQRSGRIFIKRVAVDLPPRG